MATEELSAIGCWGIPGWPHTIMLMIIDAHAHIYDILTGYGARGEFRPLGQGKGIWSTGEVNQFFPPQYGDLGFHAETLLQLMEEGGIDHAVLLQGSNYGFHSHYAAETARTYPNRFTAAITADPYATHAKEILRYFTEDYGIHILKFELSKAWGLRGYHPELTPDAPVMLTILEQAAERGMTVVIDPGPVENMEAETASFLRLRDNFPDLPLVFAHCFFPKGDGMNELRLRLLEKLAEADLMFDISNHLCLWHIDPLCREALDYLQGVKDAVGTGRMIWGTDVPGVLRTTSYQEMIAVMENCGIFSSEERKDLMCENAKRIYGIHL